MATWFDRARFGLFVHWGHSSQQGIELSWPLTGGMAALPEGQGVSVEQYHSSAATFDPRSFDAPALARLAKRAGIQYAVLTAKHHDGYAMFDTKVSDFSIMHSPYGRDIVRQYVDAMRAAGLRVGLYYSLIDWHHPDYPPFTQADQPYRWGQWPKPDTERWPRFIEFMFAQVRELLTNYGRIDVIWFDGGWERSLDEWRSKELEAMIRSLQPEILINDRLPGCGDYATPEQFVPAKPPEGPWETCMTMNESWGYNPGDTKYKSTRQLIHTLCEVAGRGGNLLLNVSPMGDGRLPPEQVERLEAIASWMERHSESIIATEPGLEPWQYYGSSTQRDNTTYLHLLMRPYESVMVRGLRVKRVERVRVLGSGKELKFSWRCSIPDRLLNPDPIGELTIEAPEGALDEQATVLAVEMRDAIPGVSERPTKR
jgi:alpha-L-fucosidase